MMTGRNINSGQSNFQFDYIGESETEFENLSGEIKGPGDSN
jgi:hypothetical protein